MNGEFWQLPGRKGILAASRQEGYAKKGVRRGPGVPGGSPGHPKSVPGGSRESPEARKSGPERPPETKKSRNSREIREVGRRPAKKCRKKCPRNEKVPKKAPPEPESEKKPWAIHAQRKKNHGLYRSRSRQKGPAEGGRWSTGSRREGKEGNLPGPARDRCCLEPRQVPGGVRRV